MNKAIKKTISVLILSAFFFNMVLPPQAAQAMTTPWWANSQILDNANITPGPSGEGGNDDLKNQQQVADPVLVHNGDYVYRHRDLLIPSRGIDTEIMRVYKSKSRYDNRFGYGWDMTYNKKIIPLCNGDLYYLNGELNRYRFIYVDGINYISPAGIYDKITQNPDGTYTLKEKHGKTYEFDQNGVLTDTRDRNGNSLHFTYATEGKDGVPVEEVIIGISVFSDDPDPKVIAYDYKLIKITDATGRETNLNYNDAGRLESIVDFSGRTYTYTYDPSGNGDLISVTTPATEQYPSGTVTAYAYQAHRLVSITDAKNQTYLVNHYDSDGRVDSQNYGEGTFTFAYDPGNRRTTVTNPKGFITEWSYDDNGGIISKKEFTAGLRPTDPAFYTTNSTYNAALERTQVTYPKGNGIKYTFDEGNPDFQKIGNLLQIRRKSDMAQPDNDANDIVTRFTYEPQFNFIKTLTDPKGNVTTYTYDYELDPGDPRYGTRGNLVKIAYPPVNAQVPEVNLSYNAFGQPIEVVDPNNNLTRYEYFPNTGYLQKIIQDPNGIDAVSEFTYDAFGNIASVKDPELRTTGFVYDELNHLIRQTDPLGYLTKYSYDANGNLVKVERQANTQGNEWQASEYTYTILDKLATIKDPLNHITTFTYDLNDNRRTVLDAQGNTTTYDYDERDLLWKVTDANAPAGVTEYAYDLNGQLAQIKDANTNPTNYAYDLFDRLQTMTYADASFSQYGYDKNSNLTQHQTPGAALINYEYDALNRLSAKRFPASAELDVIYGYDLGSRLTAVSNQPSAASYQYDALNRITQNTQTLNANPYTLAYQYDKTGNRTRVTYPSGKVVNNEYDALNRLAQVSQAPNTLIARFEYDTLSRRVLKNMPVAGWGYNTRYYYDAADRLTQMFNRMIAPNVPNQPNIQAVGGDGLSKADSSQPSALSHQMWRVFKLIAESRKLIAVSEVHAAPPGTVDVSQFRYTYDNVGNRLTQQTQQTQSTYGYDDVYQLTGVSGAQTHNYDYDAVGNREVVDGIPYVPNNLNQYTFVAAVPYSYDGNGNLTNDGTNTYTYDTENHLSSVSGLGSGVYSYDGLGRRISKTVGGSTTYFVYDGDQIIEERDSNGTLLASYTYGEGIDEVLTMNRGGQDYFYFYNGLGSVTNIANSRAQVVESYQYDVYGNPSTLSTIGNRYYFTGRELDEESGLYHYRARAYSPSIGRLFSRDPIGYYDSMNLYSYVNNNPINYFDPFGEDTYYINNRFNTSIPTNRWLSHSFVAITERDPLTGRERVVETFSWVNTGGGMWEDPYREQNREGAQAAIDRGVGARFKGDSSLDPYVKKEFEKRQNEKGGFWPGSRGTCKDQAKKLIEDAQQQQLEDLITGY
ncbi:MAG TPA: RHS repeat-associated core domain-containing protein [Candidatus Omnitrophota bacterium]|nr:RHS repeat-associated core domain-containing protein [Candidatus Omnitrophota bacterium]HPD84175.1 RHS repeat-associated core domain-containing protein [Candidatus Omnitrophota bacterium]HRZ03032.1 RHS repeat-associated core domain-containing protein [Candidatus Omnitrophota bacterium]